VMSAGLWSSSRSRPPVSSTRSGAAGRPAQLIFVPAPRNRTLPRLSRSTLTASSTLVGRSTVEPAGPGDVVAVIARRLPSEPFDHAGLLERVRPPRTRALTTQPGGGQHLARVAHAFGVERGAHQRHR